MARRSLSHGHLRPDRHRLADGTDLDDRKHGTTAQAHGHLPDRRRDGRALLVALQLSRQQEITAGRPACIAAGQHSFAGIVQQPIYTPPTRERLACLTGKSVAFPFPALVDPPRMAPCPMRLPTSARSREFLRLPRLM